jgi:hypothetical protein
MSKVKFVTDSGEELSSNEMVQRLMKRVSLLESESVDQRELIDNLLTQVGYLEWQKNDESIRIDSDHSLEYGAAQPVEYPFFGQGQDVISFGGTD